jgi:hypothetical protein
LRSVRKVCEQDSWPEMSGTGIVMINKIYALPAVDERP